MVGFFRIFQRLKQCLNVHDCNICKERGKIATALARVSTFHNFTGPRVRGALGRGAKRGPGVGGQPRVL